MMDSRAKAGYTRPMSEPTPYWAPGNTYRGGQRLAVWTREHATYDTAITKGKICRLPNTPTSYLALAGAGPEGGTILRLVVDAPGHPLNGREYTDREQADRDRYDAGMIGVTEELTPPASPARTPLPVYRDPDAGDDYDPDPGGRYADGAAANMVYGGPDA